MWVVGAPLLDTVTAVTFTVKYKNNNFKIHKHAHLGSNYTYTPPQFGLKVVGTVLEQSRTRHFRTLEGADTFLFQQLVFQAFPPSFMPLIHTTYGYRPLDL